MCFLTNDVKRVLIAKPAPTYTTLVHVDGEEIANVLDEYSAIARGDTVGKGCFMLALRK